MVQGSGRQAKRSRLANLRASVAPTSTSRRRSRAAVNDKPFDAGGVEDAGQGLGGVVEFEVAEVRA